ncbi:nickel-dependent lactate racemase [Fodinisporobacter ferrooxydans]|uniref:Nickel-dependent lactate racemase n=1 Tax=Fodinisporobacter ferrooxydans TaxID=2901836 RepID=A0ABY4CPX5_9BACL|nr:nickel-dependent lactate racemase [Alicyclobacillaceae bacterium MYW30-H2]
MDVIASLLQNVPIPKFIPVRQHFTRQQVSDVETAVYQAIADSHVAERIQAGQEIGIAVGSRGIDSLPTLVRALVQVVKNRGGRPFIFPAMGSHGGATAEGQTAMLEHLGVTESSVGAPIRSSMETVDLGASSLGLPVYADRYAAQADGIIVLNRIKPHTSFHGKVESGLLKMLTIGVGKQKGADKAHQLGFAHMPDHIWDISKTIIEKLPILFGLAVLENGYDKTAKVIAVPAERLHEEEPRLLDEARALMPKILFDPLDVLIVDQIGKDISGVGLDPNVTGRFPNSLVSGDLRVSKIAVLRLTERTDGNAAGVGLADVTTAAVERNIDRVKGYMNSLTSTTMTTIKLPMVLDSDKMAIQAAVKTCNCANFQEARIVRIKNTLHLEAVWISESLFAEAQEQDNIEILGTAQDLPFDEAGHLSI